MIRDDNTLYGEGELIERGLTREWISEGCAKGLISPRRTGGGGYQFTGREIAKVLIDSAPDGAQKSKQEWIKEFASAETLSLKQQARSLSRSSLLGLSKPLRLQFSVRTALVMMTLAGILLAGLVTSYQLYFSPSRILDGSQAVPIVQGMTPLQIRWAIGPPHIAVRTDGRDTNWTYKTHFGAVGATGTCEIDFGPDGKVQSTTLSGGTMPGMGGGFM